ncbi:MAG TPA: nitrate reductase [Acidimicrobiales bacterium]|jgi:assimilatory nitrate reductase catalytic subunit|nr:nitrate reductase [Acidimicrobiales bacterium]
MSRPHDADAWLGVGTHAEDYRYGTDERFGVMAESRRPQHWVATTCGYCSVGCGMLIGVRDGAAVAVRGDPDHPVNHGRLCPKGLSEHHTMGAPGRLSAPLVRSDREQPLAPASWEDAVDRVVGGFTAIRQRHGPDAVAILSTGQLVTEEFYALGKLARVGLGVRHYDGNTTLCMSSAVSGYKLSFGSDGPPGAYEDFDVADCILLVGANIADNHPLLAPRVLGNDAATVIVVDPRVTKTAMIADLHLAIRPRTDITLLNAMMRVIVDEGLVDTGFVEAHTDGYPELLEHLATIDVAAAAAECGISEESLRRAALTFGRAERAVAAWTMGVNHSVQGTETVTLINDLCLITGNIGRPGAGPMSITGQCNAMGTREAGATASLPGYRAFDDDTARGQLAELWGVPMDAIPEARGRAYPDVIDGVVDGTIRALWIVATNPPVSFPDRRRLEAALARLDLLVVQDGFETPTTALAHVVLPAAIWGEKEGTFTNSERRVCRVRAAVAPPGEARSDLDIFFAVAERLGVRDQLFPGWKGPEDAFAEWATVSAGRLCDYSGITYDRIDAAGGVQWPCSPEVEAAAGTARLYGDGRFPTPSGRAQLRCVSPQPISEPPGEEFPLLLNTGRTVEHWHTRTKTGRVGILEGMAPGAWVEINPDDARRLGVATGSRVRVRSARGAIDHLAVRVTATVRPGEVFIPFHYDEQCVNILTLAEFDPISREPNYKQCAVRVELSR